MAKFSNTPSNSEDHETLISRFDKFKKNAGIQGKHINLIGSPSIKDNRLYAQVIHPRGYADDFWEMIANDLSHSFLTLVNKTYEGNVLNIKVALMEECWHTFADEWEIKTEKVVAIIHDKQPALDVEFWSTITFEDENEFKRELANHQLTIAHEFEPQGLIHRIVFYVKMK